jgi:hypothetical protein
MESERRYHTRTAYSGRAYLTYAGRCRSDEIVEISEGGVKLRTSARIRPGKAVKVFLPLPAERGWRLCMLKGHVVRRERQGVDNHSLAIELLEDEGEGRKALQAFIATQGAA